jgi:hypothetical protein
MCYKNTNWNCKVNKKRHQELVYNQRVWLMKNTYQVCGKDAIFRDSKEPGGCSWPQWEAHKTANNTGRECLRLIYQSTVEGGNSPSVKDPQIFSGFCRFTAFSQQASDQLAILLHVSCHNADFKTSGIC